MEALRVGGLTSGCYLTRATQFVRIRPGPTCGPQVRYADNAANLGVAGQLGVSSTAPWRTKRCGPLACLDVMIPVADFFGSPKRRSQRDSQPWPVVGVLPAAVCLPGSLRSAVPP